MALAEETPPDRLHWLSLAELFSTRMDTEGKDGAYLIAHAGAPSPTRVDDAGASAAAVAVSPAFPEYAFLTERRAGTDLSRLIGRVRWSASIMGHVPVLQADADFGPATGRVLVEIVALDPAPDKLADRIKLDFEPKPAGLLGTIATLDTPRIRFEQGSEPMTLEGTVERSSANRFYFDPPDDPARADHEARLILASECLDIPITISPDVTAVITIQRGETGTNAFGDWRQLAKRTDAKAAGATSP